MKARLSRSAGQSLIEFSLVLPLMLTLVLGIIEVGYALVDQHVVTKLSREGSNLISRDVTLQDAASAMKSMRTRPVDFDNGSKLILSVIKKVATAGSPNFDKVILYQRHEYGTLAAASVLTTKGPVSFGGHPTTKRRTPTPTPISRSPMRRPVSWSSAAAWRTSPRSTPRTS